MYIYLCICDGGTTPCRITRAVDLFLFHKNKVAVVLVAASS